MFRVTAWLSLIVLVTLPQGAEAKPLCPGEAPARVTRQPANPCAPVQSCGVEPVELGDDGEGIDGDGDAENAGAVQAARLAPAAPRSEVLRAKSPHAGVLWSLAIQECGPPRA